MIQWTPEDDETLRRMAGDGASSAQIGMALHRSRNSIIGRARRIGATLLQLPSDQRHKPVRKGVRHRKDSAKSRIGRLEMARVRNMPIVRLPSVGPLGIALLDHQQGQCRWVLPIPGQRYCGEGTEGDPSWCPTHRAAVYQPIARKA